MLCLQDYGISDERGSRDYGVQTDVAFDTFFWLRTCCKARTACKSVLSQTQMERLARRALASPQGSPGEDERTSSTDRTLAACPTKTLFFCVTVAVECSTESGASGRRPARAADDAGLKE